MDDLIWERPPDDFEKEVEAKQAFAEAEAFLEAEDWDKAVPLLQRLAREGNAYAQHALGDCYLCGHGVDEDKAQAAAWYRKAAEQDNAGAQCDLGDCYYLGRGVTKDLAQAVAWYRKAAEQGYEDAEEELESMKVLGII